MKPRFWPFLVPLALAGSVNAQVTQRVNLSSAGAQGNGGSIVPAPSNIVSSDGRYVAYMSFAANLVPGDTNQLFDVFVRDRLNETNERVSVGSLGVQGNDDSGIGGISISADGRYVAFDSFAGNLVAGDTNAAIDVFVHDRSSGSTVRLSVDSSGAQTNAGGFEPSISVDGRYVCFTSASSSLVSGDTNGVLDIFLHDTQTGTTERMSVAPGGVQSDALSFESDLTPDGRFVVFSSLASNLAAGVFGGFTQIYVRDMLNGSIECASLAAPGLGGAESSFHPSVSDDGRYVCFGSRAADLVSGDNNGVIDTFVHDRQTGLTELCSSALGGGPGNAECGLGRLSGDGRWVVFASDATNLVPGDTNLTRDIFLRDRLLGSTERLSVNSAGAQTTGDGRADSISRDGRFAVFTSPATDLVPGDTNGFIDVFLRDRFASGFTSRCEPGLAGVIGCPCGNPPAAAGRGCDNSSATGGAVLAAAGVSYLASDSLVFTTSGEKPAALSILLQGDSILPNGTVFGQGVRCAGGALKRLFVKTASGGSITAPDFSAGDPSVSARSAALGTPILAGQPYAYLVYYRDPVVLGGCSTASTFNATQTGVISWWP